MSYAKKSSSAGGVMLYSPPQSTRISSNSTDTDEQSFSTRHSTGTQQPSGAATPTSKQGRNYGPEDCINDIRKICKDSQARVQALSQAIGRQPGMPASLGDLLNNDLRNIAQQFVTTMYHCHVLERKVEELTDRSSQEGTTSSVAHEAQMNSLRNKLQNSQDRVRKLEQDMRDMEQGYATAEKRRKVEIEKKTEKISNQKRRIREQQDQIDNLKKKPSDGSKASKGSKSTKANDSSPDVNIYNSATSEIGARNSPCPPRPKYTSTLDGKDEEFLLNNLKKLNVEFDAATAQPPRPLSRSTRMEQDNYGGHPPLGYGQYGMPPPMGPMGPTPGAIGPYGAYPPPIASYGGLMPNYGRPPPPAGPMTPYHGYGAPGYPTHGPHGQARPHSHSARGSEHQSSALVIRRNDDSDFDPETKIWKDLFFRLFTASFGWSDKHCRQIALGAVEEATKANPRLWNYILKVASCHKDPQAAAKHALFMLNSPDHRCYFISRLLLQYVEQEMLHWKFWLGWDEETDVQLNKIGPIIDYIGYPLEQRRAARQELRQVVEGIVKDEEWPRFRSFKTAQNANRLKDIAGPFLNSEVGADASLGLHSLCNIGIEISNKMMSSRLSFAFTWNECAVKFSHDSHTALNSDLHGMSLQHKHIRVALVVTPSISYRDDSGVSIVPRGVCKAQVLVMN
ncbi:hypothetical protein M406DRAFT_68448 [Cryphonectria parasitica EP155]|uniref:Uncharacterized protein n=1 Tax=Cryphonectria parasitica (strain ATCC 38755 / EP155) TaxID=660469 RepID=A0A9P4Y3Q3_CRYP1|nr:uncharacterized protein M406DRAFT_68448 [Cryphonectria parasitica EP155]KAF3766066.1 hypothetical protein M406DRAFT_68448 [Cryphonectria parasitica EP155]